MCGRYTLYSEPEALASLLEGIGAHVRAMPALTKRYNIAPTQTAWAVTAAGDGPKNAVQVVPMAFGFRPAFMSHGVINARAETVQDKPMFRRALAQRRCLIVASGFYEWQKREGGTKQPHHFTLATRAPFVFAGLYRAVEAKDPGFGRDDQEFVILTTEANACVAPVHPRMPVILETEAARLWLSRQLEPPAAHGVLTPFAAERMVSEPVSSRVNRATQDDPGCIAAVDLAPIQGRLA